MDDVTPERWLPVVGFEQYYQVSDWGRVLGLRSGVIHKPSYSNGGGYPMVILTVKGVRYGRYNHILVLEAFVGLCPPGLECLHDDGNPRNAALSNLKWGTHAENMEDRRRHGTDHNVAKTRCDNGHEYTPENTYFAHWPDGTFKGRACRACANDETKVRYRARLTSGKICTAEEGCDDPQWVKKLCVKHYARQYRAAHPRKPQPRTPQAPWSKNCEHCAEAFQSKRSDARFCSRTCIKKAEWAKKKRQPEERTCDYCRDPFTTTFPWQRYCSRRCSRRDNGY